MDSSAHPGRAVKFGELEIDCDKRQARRGSVTTKLTSREAEVLAYLEQRAGTIIPRSELEKQVWEFRAGVQSMAVPVAMRRLRDKLEIDPSHPKILLTHKGRGYELKAPDQPKKQKALKRYETKWIPRPEVEGAVATALAESRLVTLLGAGGMGKTRLAIEAAGAHGGRAAMVDLTTVPQGGEASAAVVRALDCTDDELVGRLTAFDLLVLDNAEHVVDGVANLASRLLKDTAVTLLVTSRADLRLAAERVVTVPPLSTEQALALLQQHRMEAGGDRATQIVEGVDRVPLAIELIAHLRGDLDQVLRAVVQERGPVKLRGRTERQSSVDGAIRWSWELLNEDAREVLRVCALWSGPVDLKGVAALCEGTDTDAAIEELVEQSLLERSGDGIRVLWMVRAFVGTPHGERSLKTRWEEWVLAEADEAEVMHRATWAARERFLSLVDSLWAVLEDEEATPEIRGRAGLKLCQVQGSFPLERIFETLGPIHHELSRSLDQELRVMLLVDRFLRSDVNLDVLYAAPRDALSPESLARLGELESGQIWTNGDWQAAETRLLAARAILPVNGPSYLRITGILLVLSSSNRPEEIQQLLHEAQAIRLLADNQGWDAASLGLLDDELNLLTLAGEDRRAQLLATQLLDELRRVNPGHNHRVYALRTAALALAVTDPTLGASSLHEARLEFTRDGRGVPPDLVAVEATCHFLAGDLLSFDRVSDMPYQTGYIVFKRIVDCMRLARAADRVAIEALDPIEIGEGLGPNGSEVDGRRLQECLLSWMARARGEEVPPRPEGPRCLMIRAFDNALDR